MYSPALFRYQAYFMIKTVRAFRTSCLWSLPTDPSLNTANITDCTANAGAWGNTGYEISRDAQNRITVSAPTTDNAAVITVTR